ncbi:MAG TPA: GHKL domain-containing protein [Syntrophomonadaceae bacterium]|nr:GHKL domain-containing protein [Syntrophomonadaceae bacterium]
MPLELKRYLFLIFPYVMCSTLAALIIWGEDVKKHLPRLLIFALLSSATQNATYLVHNEALRFPLEVASGFLVAWLVLRKSLSWTFKIYGTSYLLGITTMIVLEPVLLLVFKFSTAAISNDSVIWLESILPADLLMVGIALLVRRTRLPALNFLHSGKEITARLWPIFLAVFIQLVIFVALVTEFLNEEAGYQAHLNRGLILLITAVLFLLSLLIILLFLRHNRRGIEMATQEALSDNIFEMVNSISGQRHDFLNHLQVMRILHQQNKQEALGDYLEEILQESSRYNEILKIDNPILSALINAKITQAELRGIEMEVDVHSSLSGLAPTSMDIARILGNLIDNALDEVEKAAVSGKVRLEIREEGPLLIVLVRNPYAGDPEDLEKALKKGLSTKGSGHSGLGIYICRRLARKIHSSFDYTLEPGRITFTLTIPKQS